MFIFAIEDATYSIPYKQFNDIAMDKKYEIPDNEPVMANEDILSIAAKHTPLHLDITLEDNAMIADIKQAIKMIKGITSVRVVDDSMSNSASIDPFAELDTSWGGDRDANEIADELHSMRSDTRVIESW